MLARSFVAVFVLTFAALRCGGTIDHSSASPDCDALMKGSSTCSIEGEKCESPAQSACVGAATLYCTCESGAFACEVPPPTCPLSCPSPDQVKLGATCEMQPGSCPSSSGVTDCQGNFVPDECSCGSNGSWECSSSPQPPCTFDAGTTD